MVRAREFHRLGPARGGNHLIAMRLKEIGEELHIELIVFDDENRLGHVCFDPAQGYKLLLLNANKGRVGNCTCFLEGFNR
jgi:hypothetical protein